MNVKNKNIIIGTFIGLLFFICSCNKGQSSSGIENKTIGANVNYSKRVFLKDIWGRGLENKFIELKYYTNDTLFLIIELSSLAGDTLKLNSLTTKYMFASKYKEYVDTWLPQKGGKMQLSHTYIKNSEDFIDTTYLYYQDKTVKKLSYYRNRNPEDEVIINYKQGEYFIDLQRIDTLPGVIPTDYYYIME